ncbi:MAG: hypothetical protein WCJ02_11350, partial [bacterium]
MISEEEAVGGGEIEEAGYAVVDVGFDGDQAGSEVGVLTLPVGKGNFPVRPLFDRDFNLEGLAQFGAEGGEIECPPF